MNKEQDFLGNYFVSVYNKLEADAMLFNRKLPHSGLMGNENELVLSKLLRDFLPPRFGIENSGIVIDKKGKSSKQCDIIICDAYRFPKYFRKVFPVEIVYGVIEVKTLLTAKEADNAIENIKSVFELDFRPAVCPFPVYNYEERKKEAHASPPFGIIFSYRTNVKNFETFAKWFPLVYVHEGIKIENHGYEIRVLKVVSLDQGIIELESSNEYVMRRIPIAEPNAYSRSFDTKVSGQKVKVDPAKVLFFTLDALWNLLANHYIYPLFEIRSYIKEALDSFSQVEDGCE